MAISGKKISALEELASIQGTEYIPVLSGNTNKKLKIDKIAKKEEIPDVSKLTTKEELSAKMDKVSTESVYENTKELAPGKYYIFGEVETLTLTLAAGEEGKLAEYMFEFTSGATPTTITDIAGIEWKGDTIEANKVYQASISRGIGILIGREKV